jgi:simple sugar transport system permease protein
MTEPAVAPPEARPAPTLWRSAWRASLVPVCAVLVGLMVGALIMMASSWFAAGGFQPLLPLQAYGALLQGSIFSTTGLVSTAVQAAPLILAGLAVGIGFKAGLFNIGASGQFLLGAITAAALGYQLASSPGYVAIPVALLAAALAGAAWGFIPGALKAWTGAHEVVTTIMLNFIAATLVKYLITGPFGVPGFSFDRTGAIGNAALPVLFGRDGHLGIFIALAVVPVIWWMLWRSTLGFEIRTVGANPSAARYAGMHPGRLTILTMSLCGLLAGLAGAGQILGISHFMNASYSTAIGFDAITVALLGKAHPVGIVFAAILFGIMRAGSGLMQISAGVPVEIVDVLQAVILLFLTADVIIRRLFRIRAAKGTVDEIQTVTRSYGEQTSV